MHLLKKLGVLGVVTGTLLCTQLAYAQNHPLQTCSAAEITATQRWWYFGNNTGMDFGTTGSAPTAISPANPIVTSEGTTVVTNTTGQLQFWVGGNPTISIYDKNHNVMSNGAGLTAQPSAVQTAVSFPAMGVPGKYFVITTTG